MLDAWKRLDSELVTLIWHIGWLGREPLNGESKPFNRRYGKLHTTIDALDIGIAGLFASAAVEYHWAGSGFAEGNFSVGGSAGYERKWMRVQAGTYYESFKYVYFADLNEVNEVRTYFGSAELEILPWLRLEARYALERFDRDIHTVTASVTQQLDLGQP